MYVTNVPPSSSNRLGGASPSKRTSPYGSSSSTGRSLLAGELGDPAAALLGERPPARILERRDRVEERDVAAARKLGGQRVGIEPLLVHRQRHDVRPGLGEQLQRPVVGRPLDEDASRPAREQLGGVEDEPLQPAARDRDPGRGHAVALAEQLPQRAVATAGAVGEDRRPVALERRPRAVGDQVGREAFGGGRAARKGDRRHRQHPNGGVSGSPPGLLLRCDNGRRRVVL